MRQLGALVWKEWCEVRAFLWIGLGVFIGLPLIGAVEALWQHAHHFELQTTPWVLPFAGVLAVFVAVGSTCRDLNGRLEEFWQSQPAGVLKRLLVKYFVDLAVVLTVCVLPLAIEWGVNKKRDPMLLVEAVMLPFVWTAVYSLGFAAGCLVRRTAHAGMLALSAMLLVYFLPLVFPPLEWLNVESVVGVPHDASWAYLTPQEVRFPLGMLGISLASLTLAVVAVSRRWRVDSGRKMMYGAVSSAILIVFASVAYRLGTNLPVLQQIDLPKYEFATYSRVEGQRGFLITMREVPNLRDANATTAEWVYRPLEIGPTNVELGEATRSGAYYQYSWQGAAWDPDHPDVEYSAAEYLDSGKDVCFLYRNTFPSNQGEVSPMPRKLWEYEQEGKSWGKQIALCIWQNHLYVIGTRLVRIDLDHPYQRPEVLAAPFPYAFDNQMFGPDKIIVRLPPVPQLPPRQRLEAALNQPNQVLENDILCASQGESLFAYHLTKLTEATATFEKTGQYEESLLEKIFGSFRYSGIKLRNGLLYVSGAAGGGLFNPHVTVFDARGDRPLRPVGHFAAPGSAMLACPLPDGRSLIAGSKLWVVGPPPLRRPG